MMAEERLIEPQLIRAKIAQAHDAMQRQGIDLWLVFLQETSVYREPILDYLIGQDVTWQSAFLYTATGEAIAIVGNFDVESFEARGCFSNVLGYTRSIAEALTRELRRLNPRQVALNYAADNPAADGLTYGLYLVLSDIIKAAGLEGRIVSANPLVRTVRGCKSEEELRSITEAVHKTERAFVQLLQDRIIGQTEMQIAARIADLALRCGSGLSFATIVNAGAKSAVGHTHPTDAVFEPGDLLHIDFGFTHEGYCADLQRCVYALKKGESEAPPALLHAFTAVSDTIQNAFRQLKPGVLGRDIDADARRVITSRGYPEYQHALGHQLGRSVHDGGALLGPEWARYGGSPRWPVEPGQVFTLELEVELPGVGYASLEEDVVVTHDGAEWLSTPQTTPALLHG